MAFGPAGYDGILKPVAMKQAVTKAPKIAICRACHGTGTSAASRFNHTREVCPQCEGSGRVVVKCSMEIDIRPYKPKGD